jgi:hypothetical protein
MEENTRRTHRSFNRLRYVCKQLYAETAGMELQFNSILFSCQPLQPFVAAGRLPAHRNPIVKSAEQWFQDFTASITRRKLKWLSTVIITSGLECLTMRNLDAPAMPNLPVLATFCKKNPKIELHYYFQNFDFDHDDPTPVLNFLTARVALTTAVKGADAGKKARDDLLEPQPWVRVLYEESKHGREIWRIEYFL